MSVSVIAVAPIDSPVLKRLRRAGGWRPVRTNGHTETWSRAYDHEDYALCDARTLPKDVVWGIERTEA
jgi:hypothetical protein